MAGNGSTHAGRISWNLVAQKLTAPAVYPFAYLALELTPNGSVPSNANVPASSAIEIWPRGAPAVPETVASNGIEIVAPLAAMVSVAGNPGGKTRASAYDRGCVRTWLSGRGSVRRSVGELLGDR